MINPAEIFIITYLESDEDFSYWYQHYLKESHKIFGRD